MGMPDRRSDDEQVGVPEVPEAGTEEAEALLEGQATIETEETSLQVEELKSELRRFIVAEIRARYQSQNEAAEAIGVATSYVNGLIHNNRSFSLHYLIQIANRLGIRVKFVCLLTRCT